MNPTYVRIAVKLTGVYQTEKSDLGYTVDLQELTVLIVLLRALYVVNPNVKIRFEINPIWLMR